LRWTSPWRCPTESLRLQVSNGVSNEVAGRTRSSRCGNGRHVLDRDPGRHGPEFRFTKPETWPEAAVVTRTDTANYGKAETQAWDRIHPRLTHRAAWLEHEGELPLIEGTLIRLKVEHLSKDREAPAVWLWSSRTGATDKDVDRAWKAFLRRFDLEHTFRLFKQTRGWTRPRLREPLRGCSEPGGRSPYASRPSTPSPCTEKSSDGLGRPGLGGLVRRRDTSAS
jgi:hypothetical protein